MFPCGLITVSVRCCPSQAYDKRSWRPHTVFSLSQELSP